MTVIKFYCGIWITFQGTDRAIDTFTAIHGKLSDRGFDINLPGTGQSATFSLAGIGKVELARVSETRINVKYIYGPVVSFLKQIFRNK